VLNVVSLDMRVVLLLVCLYTQILIYVNKPGMNDLLFIMLMYPKDGDILQRRING
jgi:hypothetical protein